MEETQFQRLDLTAFSEKIQLVRQIQMITIPKKSHYSPQAKFKPLF